MKSGAIQIYAKNGSVVVERLYCGVVIERYKTNHPEQPRKKDEWSAAICEWFRKPRVIAEEQIVIPRPTVEEREYTRAHCSGDMRKNLHCSNEGSCVSIEDFDRLRDSERESAERNEHE